MTKNKFKKSALSAQIVLTILAIVWFLPILWIVLTSFRGEGGRFVPYFIPKELTLQNYQTLFQSIHYPFPQWFANTLKIAVCSCLISTTITLCMAYVFSRLRFKLRKRMMQVALVLNMFPSFMSMIAVYYLLKAVGLVQSHLALVLLYSSGAALSFYIAKGFFDTVPRALDESALIDGATKAQVFTKITLPLSKPIIVYTALTAFMSPWMDFIFAKVILGDDIEKYTVAIGLFTMMDKEVGASMFMPFTAGCILVAIPISMVFMFMQRFYVEGVTGGAVKG